MLAMRPLALCCELSFEFGDSRRYNYLRSTLGLKEYLSHQFMVIPGHFKINWWMFINITGVTVVTFHTVKLILFDSEEIVRQLSFTNNLEYHD